MSVFIATTKHSGVRLWNLKTELVLWRSYDGDTRPFVSNEHFFIPAPSFRPCSSPAPASCSNPHYRFQLQRRGRQ